MERDSKNREHQQYSLLLQARFGVFMMVKIQVAVFWVMTSCNVGYQHFRRPCCLHLHSKVCEARKGIGMCEPKGRGVKLPVEASVVGSRKKWKSVGWPWPYVVPSPKNTIHNSNKLIQKPETVNSNDCSKLLNRICIRYGGSISSLYYS
jgi:hypothetical protein